MKHVITFEKFTSWPARSELEQHDTGLRVTMTFWNGVVEVFTHDGSQHTPAFTSVEYRSKYRVYVGRIGRFYHKRWLKRIARLFVEHVEDVIAGRAP